MQLNIKKYESINIYVLLQDNIIIGMYHTYQDADLAKDSLEYCIPDHYTFINKIKKL